MFRNRISRKFDITSFKDTLPQSVVEKPNTFSPIVEAFGQDYINVVSKGMEELTNSQKVDINNIY